MKNSSLATTDNTNAPEETSTTNNQQDNQEKIEFNGKTHSQNVQAAKESRDQGGQWAGASDEEIERLISQDEKNGGRI